MHALHIIHQEKMLHPVEVDTKKTTFSTWKIFDKTHQFWQSSLGKDKNIQKKYGQKRKNNK
jgi:hypothetical protein